MERPRRERQTAHGAGEVFWLNAGPGGGDWVRLPMPVVPESPRLNRITEDLRLRGPAGVEALWRQLGEEGSPLIEPLAGAPDERLVSFLWRDTGEQQAVTLVGGFATNPAETRLARLGQSDLWYRTFRVPADARATYVLSPDDPDALGRPVRSWTERTATWGPDPFNPDHWSYPPDPDGEAPAGDPQSRGMVWSRVDLPDAPPLTWSERYAGPPQGRLARHRRRAPGLSPCPWLSADSQSTRRVWVYTPSGYRPTGQPHPLLLLLDGWDYLNLIPTPTILDNLVASGRLPPLVAVFVENPVLVREDDLGCNPALLEFLSGELLPWVRQRYNVTREPSRTVIGGLSLGGLAASHAAVTRPDLFGKVLSQSASFWWKPHTAPEFEWLTGEMAARPHLQVRFHLSVGRLETWTPVAEGAPTLLLANRHVREVLDTKGCLAGYTEFSGGHQWVCWEAALPEALTCLLCA